MTIVRQDAWSNDEDLVLAEVVLRHIREGSTQLAAFEEVGERLSRTAAACGFRWNSSIRKKYEAAITIAKKQRKNLKKTPLAENTKDHLVETASEVPIVETTVAVIPEAKAVRSIDDVIEFLTGQKLVFQNNNELIEENVQLKERFAKVSEEKQTLAKELSELKENFELMKQDYKLLIDIMDRAKQLSASKG